MKPNDQSAFDLTAQLDGGRWTMFQKGVLLMAALAIVLDGFDNQILGFAVPSIIEDWGVPRSAFAPIIALTLIAMSIGTAAAGFIGDRIGRRPALIGSLVIFGLMTGASAFVHDIYLLGFLRVVAALGLGGAMPNATALLAEYTPAQRRSLSVTLGIVCVPLGGLAGGLLAGVVLPEHGWRGLFMIGGALPLVAALVMVFLLPESPAFLARRPNQRARLERILARCDLKVPPDAVLAPAAGAPRADGTPSKSSAASVFGAGFVRDTLALWLAFLSCLLGVYLVFNWAPTMISAAGFDLAVASNGLAGFNFGGIAGALLGAWLMDRAGSRLLTVSIAALGALIAAVLAFRGFSASDPTLWVVGAMAALGFFVVGLQVLLFALAAQVYPAAMRATGVGLALAVGRLGAVVSSYVGATILDFGDRGYFLVIALSMVVSAMSLFVLRRHIPAGANASRSKNP